MSAKHAHRRRQQGMTLMELLTVIVIVGILASVAVGSYRGHLLRTNRTDARATLLRVQVAQEKFFLQNNTYTVELGPSGLRMAEADGAPLDTPGGFYRITVMAGSTGAINSSYSATATAQNGQTKDTLACHTLTLNDQGQKTPADSSGCWK